ncbi:MAG: hypothetical protein VB046_05990 [Paludibacter sp.]|jgi:hypothetical protein|nr:hypothetical protein [Paludibacter sp.]
MKSVYVYLVSACLFLLYTSCNNDLQPDITTGQPDIIIEMLTHVTLIEQTEYLQEGLHDDFLTRDVTAILNESTFLRHKMKRDAPSGVDTVFTYDEIPLIKETKNCTKIFTDGSTESITEFLTPLTENLIFQLTETPVSEKSRIALTKQKDGILTAYNAAGEILMHDVFPVPDMREFIDTMKVYVMKTDRNNQERQSNQKAGIKSFKQHCTTESNIYELPNGNVIVESPVNNIKDILGIYPGINGTRKSRIELNPEMTKTLQHDIFQGDNLIQRKKYTYDSSKNLMNLHHNRVICENPQSVETFTLTMNPKGYPVIRHSKEFYKTNQTRYYFK